MSGSKAMNPSSVDDDQPDAGPDSASERTGATLLRGGRVTLPIRSIALLAAALLSGIIAAP